MKMILLCAALLAAPAAGPQEYPRGTVLVISPANYPFAGVEIAGELQGAVPVDAPLLQAMAQARANQNISGVVDVVIAADSLFERGRVTCYTPAGKKVWAEKVMFNMGGGADKIAEKFAARLAEKVRGKKCP